MTERADVLIVGGGIAGISLAARLAGSRDVLVLEMEDHLGTHATGRSAAAFVEAYGSPEIRALTTRGRSFFESPPEGFSETPLVQPRGSLTYGGEADLETLRSEYELARRTCEVGWLDREEILALCPVMRPERVAAGFLEPNARDIEAAALLQGFARMARRGGVRIETGARLADIRHDGGGWTVEAGGRSVSASVLVNAAGAWAGAVGALAGLPAYGLQPLKRTAMTIPLPADLAARTARMPFVGPVDGSFYFRPDAGGMLVSLAEETPSEPCDAWPDDMDVAMALDRFHAATTVPPARPRAAWAGLRTFAADRNPVVGFDPAAPGFFWLAGQGGYGLQTSPAISAMAAALLRGEPLDAAEAALARALDPARFKGTPAGRAP
ncbi:NAD(P)/FAD-dependent oxidoreductase [Arenibaculum pallidiluteum]|uniref:NAD(P)/FAD-dependent oxidoreductase n=1 Tax=Arenibaculum pallidiluteum TaxID=2812559 RepID=UPI001A978049|nr:FAD-binding oxidoreductase [Arenibaculum pallidiluteum]